MWLDSLNAMKKASGKTTEQIARESGIPKGTLNKIFAGQTKEPKLPTIWQLVHCLGYTLDDLEGSVSEKKSPVPVETSTGEITMEESDNLLVALGYIKPGEEISDEDLAFLSHVIGLLDAWFDKRE